jgi:DNA polymerase III subunit gamma/tau
MNEDLHIKYRPSDIDTVLGQTATTKSLNALFKGKKVPHAFLFTGPSGTGKTTLSRIIAKKLDIDEKSVLEVDAASKSGVDDARKLIESLQYAGFGKNINKFVIIDECHALSKAAWQSLLKSLEDVPDHVYFALCTTEAGKVPETIQTRCTTYNLGPIKTSDILELLIFVAEEEEIDLEEKSLNLIAKDSRGSARRALVSLNKCRGCSDIDEVASVLETAENDEDVIVLCRMLVDRKRPKWEEVAKLVTRLKEKNAESVRIVVVNYLAACLMKSKKDEEAIRFLEMMDQFSTPYNASEKFGPLLMSLGRVFLSD